MRVPKVPFRFFDKLKQEIRNNVLIFVSILNEIETQNKTNWFYDFQNT